MTMAAGTRTATAALLALLAGCPPRPPEPPVAAPADATAGPPPSAAPAAVLGWSFGATFEDVAAAHPGVPVADWMVDSMPWPPETTLAGIPMFVRPQFIEGRLQSISANHEAPADFEAAFATLVAAVEADLGPADRLRCESDRGPPLPEFLALGHGLIQASWSTEDLNGEVRLEPGYGCGEWYGDRPCTPTLTAWFMYRPLAPPIEDDGMSVYGELEPPASARSAAEGQKRATDSCTVDVSAMPHAEAFGLPFGASWTDAERMLGAPFEDLGMSAGRAAHRLGGLEGRLQLSFYDGCLAVAIFVLEGEGATEQGYRTVQEVARATIGSPGAATRCVSERFSESRVPAADGLSTMWRRTDPLEGSLRLENAYDGTGKQIVLEIDYLPLRDHAPQIDFSP